MHPKNNSNGFTIVELLMAITLLAILAVGSIQVFSKSIDEAKYETTVQRMQLLRDGMVGNPELKEGGVRTSFGYLGDVGSIPDDTLQGIQFLIQNTALFPVWAIDTTARIGVGWNGPYVTGLTTPDSYTYDAWGTTFVYNDADYTITSLGANRVVGGTGYDADFNIKLAPDLFVTVTGYICENGGPLITGPVDLDLYYPDGAGVITVAQQTVVAGAPGPYSFANIPLGVRSIVATVPNRMAPTKTIGPIMLSIDHENYQIPCDRLDIAL